MPKSYGEQDKDSLKAEIASLRQQIDFYEHEDGRARNRSLALSYASSLSPENVEKTAENVVKEAKVFENYLNGKPDEDPETPVPSPS